MHTIHTIINGDTLMVESGSDLDASFAGHPALLGPGRGSSAKTGGSFASHGGNAGEGSVYGHFNGQFQPGSGGGVGAGGAFIELNIGKNVVIDGNVFAKGKSVAANHGAGSGGCIVIRTFDLRGKGHVSADGGNYYFFLACIVSTKPLTVMFEETPVYTFDRLSTDILYGYNF